MIEETICPHCRGDCAYLPESGLYLCIRCGAFRDECIDEEDENDSEGISASDEDDQVSDQS